MPWRPLLLNLVRGGGELKSNYSVQEVQSISKGWVIAQGNWVILVRFEKMIQAENLLGNSFQE